MKVTIYHNPRCSKSRQTLELIRDQGHEPLIVDYLTSPPDANTLKQLIQMLGIPARELLRDQEQEYKKAKLDSLTATDDAIIHAMLTYPRLIERPIVVANGRAVLGRPPENVLTLLTKK
jgi:arsenate reductase